MDEVQTTAIAMSPGIGNLAKAMATAQAKMKPAVKDATNPHFKSNYADLEAVNESARVLAENGVAVMCIPNGWKEGRVSMRVMLAHGSGEFISGTMEMPVSQPGNPQAVGSACTYLRRYAVSALANIATSDDDGNAAADGATNEPRKAAPKVADRPPGASPAAVQFADATIAAINAAASLADASRVLMDIGLADVTDEGWSLEAGTKLAKLKNTAPVEYARVQAAYEARKL